MRIVAGTLKGRRLGAPRVPGLRPTSEKLRETLFNVLAARVEGARVLDGFAGTGAIGLEALSRGSAHATFIEQDARVVALLRENVERCGVADRCAIIRGRFIDRCARLGTASFDLIVLDPPYGLDASQDAAARPGRSRPGRTRRPAGMFPAEVLAAAAPLLAADGVLVLEHTRRQEAPIEAAGLARTRTLVSGDSALTFYRHGAPPQGGPQP